MNGQALRIRGLVQGVGFRPTVWRIARDLGLRGDVRNDGDGVLVRLWAAPAQVDAFCERLAADCPPLARIDGIERAPLHQPLAADEFRILASEASAVHTGIVPDAATCSACRDEIFDPGNRRHRYPFTNCTHCGPRLSIVRGIPYDRANTSMDAFPMCAACAAEYADPADRRFHAQPNACGVCGPRVWLQDGRGARLQPTTTPDASDAIAAAARLLAAGRILALKGIGGFHLACDAANAAAVAELRRRKRRFDKPFALMARDAQVIARYAEVAADELALLHSPAAPIVLLARRADAPPLAPAIAPGQATLGCMLPYTPLHHLLLADWERLGPGGPLVMTSGNLSDEPQCTDNADADRRLAPVADAFLLHDRAIVNRVDDSVVRCMAGAPRLLRRARGYAPAPLALPPGFTDAPPVLALGGELKNTLCLLQDGQAIVSQHLGDLEEARTMDEYLRTTALYQELFQHRPEVLAVDLHPDYRSSRHGREWAARAGLALVQVQHHHAHIASVLAEHAWPLDGGAVLGVALDGLGYGPDGTLWGGEWLLADYRGFARLAQLRAVPMPGGTQAIRQPWRNTYAQLAGQFGREVLVRRWGGLELTDWLQRQSPDVLDTMLAKRLNSPLSSSCGRLFDAVAAALGVCREAVSYEGQAAVELEALAVQAPGEAEGYRFAVLPGTPRQLDPAPMWAALLDDLGAGLSTAVIAARFHRGLAAAVADLTLELGRERGVTQAALSGGVFQNRLLLEGVAERLRAGGMQVLLQRQVPANDGGLSLGQAAVAAAQHLPLPLQSM